MMHRVMIAVTAMSALVLASGSARAEKPTPPEGFVALFNGENLEGWWGADTEDPRGYLSLPAEKFAEKQAKSRENIAKHWRAENGELVNDGHGLFLTTNKNYGDFELLLEYKTVPKADSGIYLRGTPQVQIWDFTEQEKFKLGADKGSGGLWNNAPGQGKDPLVKADKPFGEWNKFRVVMIGDYVTVYLNDQLVVDKAKLANYYDGKLPAGEKRPVLREAPIQLQTHGGEIRWRNVFVREIGAEEANKALREIATRDGEYKSIFNGKDWDGWKGPTDKNAIEDGQILSKHGTVFTAEQYKDFSVCFEFKLPPAGNNGLALRYPGGGDTAYAGMCELQTLDTEHPNYKDIKPQQVHGSVYGMVAAKRGYLRPTGEWNFQKVTVKGHRITVELNGFVILDADVSQIKPEQAMYPLEKFGGRMRTEGHFGFAGHGDPVRYREIEVRRID